MRKVVLIISLAILSLPCISQTYKDRFDTLEEADNYFKHINTKHEQGFYEDDLPQLLAYREYYTQHLPNEINIYANVCQFIGHAYYYMGYAKEAEAIYQESLGFLRNYDIDSPLYRQQLADLGLLYTELRNYEKADELFKESIYLYEKNLDLGEFFAPALSNYALVQRALGNNLFAKMMVDWAKEILINNNKFGNVYLSTILMNVGIIYGELGYKEEGIKNLLEAKEIRQNETGLLGMPMLLNNLAVMYLDQKDYKQALKYFRESYDICQNVLYRSYIGMQLAWTLFITKDKEGLEISSKLSQEIISDVINKFTFMSNDEREKFWVGSNDELNILNTMFAYSGKDKYYDNIYDNSLFSKGLLLKTSNLIKDEIYNSGDKESISLLNKKIELEKILEQEGIHEDSLKLLKDSINSYDKFLAERSSVYASFKRELTTNWSDIRLSLNKDEAAIEFVEIPVIEKDSITPQRKYYALLVRNNQNHPKLIPLCLTHEVMELITKKSRNKLEKFISELYISDSSDQSTGNKLFSCIWEPIEKELNGVNTIYYSPIGQLNSISFGALSQNSLCLSDKYNLHLLSSTSEVIKYKQKQNSSINDAIIYGGIKYDSVTEELIAEARGYSRTHEFTRSIESDSTRSGWKYLEGTEKEASNIVSILKGANIDSRMIKEGKANEESFKALDQVSPSLLHIATHGFFLSDPIQIELNPFMQKKQAKWYSSPLLRSGLLFAGANRAWLGEDIVEGIEDGILTAEEISKLNLSKTKMVVLSACETGLGEVVSTEGVFGLQRAFKLAGVQTLIMSLWKVPDMATSKLMIEFYNNWISGLEVHQAFQKAQQLIKKEYPSPYYWAGFVMLD